MVKKIIILFLFCVSGLMIWNGHNYEKQKEIAIREEMDRDLEEYKAQLEKQPTTVEEQIVNNYVGSLDKIYGQLDISNKTKASDNLYKDDFGLYMVIDNNEIYTVDINFNDLPLDLNIDNSLISEHLHSFMEDDSSLAETIDNTHFIYHSNKINKDYNVTYVLNEQGMLIKINISQQ